MPVDTLVDAVRPDLADVALADRVFAPHYAAPIAARTNLAIPLRHQPNAEAEAVIRLATGQPVELFDTSGGWAWVRAGGCVGYLPAEALKLA